MAPKVMFAFALGFFLLFNSAPQLSNARILKFCGFEQIYNFGDSLSDTGNLIREPAGANTPFARLPYGVSSRRLKGSGRCSDGSLVIDYIAGYAGLPRLPPYKNSSADFSKGVNFAVAGATALASDVLARKGIVNPVTQSSLGVQLDWMTAHLNSTCGNSTDCAEKLSHALVMVGEIGWSDYNYALLQNKTLDEVRDMVPEVVDTIMDAVKKVLNLGATRIVVPGILPIGCLPIYKTVFQTNDSRAYDWNKCLKDLNSFAAHHNNVLKIAIDKLKHENPNAIILYGDYYNAYLYILKFSQQRGRETEQACCGTGGKYNFDLMRMCGHPNTTACEALGYMSSLSWDGVHLTTRTYLSMATWLAYHIYPQFHCPRHLTSEKFKRL